MGVIIKYGGWLRNPNHQLIDGKHPTKFHRVSIIPNWWCRISQPSTAGWWFGTFFIFPYIGNVIIRLTFIFFRGVAQPPTRQSFLSSANPIHQFSSNSSNLLVSPRYQGLTQSHIPLSSKLESNLCFLADYVYTDYIHVYLYTDISLYVHRINSHSLVVMIILYWVSFYSHISPWSSTIITCLLHFPYTPIWRFPESGVPPTHLCQ